MKEVFKGDATGFEMSDVIIEQIKYADKVPSDIQRVTLENVVDTDIIAKLQNEGQQAVINHSNPKGWFSRIYFVKNLKFDDIQLQQKYNSHAGDFGLTENYNVNNREIFKQALIKHTNDTGTQMIGGTYRTTINVNHFYNEQSGINVMYDLNGNFISGWKLSANQIDYLNTTKNIQ